MAMDAGKFNFNKNIGGVAPKTTQKQTPAGGPKESPLVQQDPSESVQLGAQPVADAKTDKISTGDTVKAEAAPQANVSSATSSIPTQVGDFLIAGVGGRSNKTSFDGLTALNGLGSNSFQSLGGNVVASASPLSPKTATKVPTTSIGLMNGIEDTSWLTTSGRVISV